MSSIVCAPAMPEDEDDKKEEIEETEKIEEIKEAEEIEEMSKRYRPLVLKTALYYSEKFGVNLDDLIQEGQLGLLELYPKCRDHGALAAFLKQRLTAYVRDAARRLAYHEGNVRLVSIDSLDRGDDGESETIVDVIPDGAALDAFAEYELHDLLRRMLEGEDRELAHMLRMGYSQREAAAHFGISQQAAARRIQRIRVKLRPYLFGFVTLVVSVGMHMVFPVRPSWC